MPEPRLALIDTSHLVGWVAVARGDQVLASRRLDEARRHARGLVPSLADLLTEQGWQPRELNGVLVSRGPGSYTGLRVGIMSAKTLAYAVGCPLLAIDTFAAIARQAPVEACRVEVLADAQQDKIYRQRFVRTSPEDRWQAETDLEIVSFTAWQTALADDAWVTGPGLEILQPRLSPTTRLAPADSWLPQPASLLLLGLERLHRNERDDPFTVEPLYLRPSSAEEKLSG